MRGGGGRAAWQGRRRGVVPAKARIASIFFWSWRGALRMCSTIRCMCGSGAFWSRPRAWSSAAQATSYSCCTPSTAAKCFFKQWIPQLHLVLG